MAHVKERDSIAVRIDTGAFRTGFAEGLTGARDGYNIPLYGHPITEQDIVSIVRNLVEVGQEGWLTDDHLRRDCGVIAGWLYRPNVLVFTAEKE